MTPAASNLVALGRDPWQLLESAPDSTHAAVREALFALGNGHISLRGGHEEGSVWPGTAQDAIFIDAAGPDTSSGIRAPNGKAIRWWVDGEPFDPAFGRIESYRRLLDFRTGLLVREFVWTSPGGRRIEVRSRRVVCFERPHVYAIEYELRPLGVGVRLVLESTLDAQSEGQASSGDSAHAGDEMQRIALERAGDRVTLSQRSRRGGWQVTSAIEQMIHVAATSAVAQEECGEDDTPGLSYSVTLAPGERVILTKYCALVSSHDASTDALAALATRYLAEARSKGFSALCVEQQSSLERFWRVADVELARDDPRQQGLRLDLYQRLQSVHREDRADTKATLLT